MKGFSYIFRHGVLIILVLGISIAYVYRQQLFPKFFEDQIQTQVDTGQSNEAMHTESATIEQAGPSTDKSPIQADANIEMEDKKALADNATAQQSQDGAVSDQQVESITRPREPTHAEDNLSAAPDTDKTLNNEQNHESTTEGRQTSDADKTNAADTADTVVDSRRTQEEQYFQIINSARHAFWQGQHDLAITRYEQAILHLPASAEAYGELGNVYYAMGKWDESGENLYQAANRLVDSGQIQRARYLMSVISGLKPERVKDLEKKLSKEK